MVALPFPCASCNLDNLCDGCQNAEGVRAEPEEEEDPPKASNLTEPFNDDESENSDDDGGEAPGTDEDEEEEDETGDIVWAPFTYENVNI